MKIRARVRNPAIQSISVRIPLMGIIQLTHSLIKPIDCRLPDDQQQHPAAEPDDHLPAAVHVPVAALLGPVTQEQVQHHGQPHGRGGGRGSGQRQGGQFLATSVGDPDPDPRIRTSGQWIRIQLRIRLLSSLILRTQKNIYFSIFFLITCPTLVETV
jgi:hypothetical protein